MDQLRQYILRVVIAAVLCGICVSLLGEKGTVGAMGKLVTGLVLALVMAAPFTHLSGFHFFDYLEDLQYQANVHTDKGQAMANASPKAIHFKCFFMVLIDYNLLIKRSLSTIKRTCSASPITPLLSSALTEKVSLRPSMPVSTAVA